MCSAVGRSKYQKEQKEVPKEQRRLLYSGNGRGRERGTRHGDWRTHDRGG
jgi:hypothetical protein